VKGTEVELINGTRHSDDIRLKVARTGTNESRRIQKILICEEEANELKSERKKLILLLIQVYLDGLKSYYLESKND
jgi:hypothetical protein